MRKNSATRAAVVVRGAPMRLAATPLPVQAATDGRLDPVSAPLQLHGDTSSLAVGQWQAQMQKRARAYFEGLRALGVAAVQHRRVTGRTFLDVTIERRRFTGKVFDGPYLVAETNRRGCPLLNSTIARLAEGEAEHTPGRWALCKYGSQAQFELDGMSLCGIRALACEFGILIQGEAGAADLSETESFAVSSAHAALLDWTERQPVLARRRLGHTPVLLERLEQPPKVTRRLLFRRLEEFEYFGGPGSAEAAESAGRASTGLLVCEPRARPIGADGCVETSKRESTH